MKKRNVAALVTDGVMRDRAGVLASALPVWCAGVAAPASVNGLTFVGWQQPIGCGGCAVFPGDVIVVDDDGAVVIPQNLVDFVAHEGAEHELYESWVFGEVEKGVKLPGLYPPNDEAKARYAAWRRTRGLMRATGLRVMCGFHRKEKPSQTAISTRKISRTRDHTGEHRD
jgi:hypothetical protein